MEKDKQLNSEFMLSALIYKQKSCEKCFKKHNEANMVLCDRCEDAYHIKCINLEVVPADTWICSMCQQDMIKLKQHQLMRKRPNTSANKQQCRKCNVEARETFYFQDQEVTFVATDISLVKCASCQYQFHSLCFSQRSNSINCTSCQATIRQNIPKGHRYFKKFMNQSKRKIAEMNFHELNNQFEQLQCAQHALQLMNLVSPPEMVDWRLIVSYEASLCYALLTRGMIYSQNLVAEFTPEKSQIICKAHKNSIQKMYRLHKYDEQAYERFKSNIENGHLPPLQVRQDRKKGFYLISTSFIPINTILAQYAGQLITARQSLNMITNDNIFTLIRNPRSSQSLDIAPSQFANIAIFISGVNNSQKDAKLLQNVRALKFSYKGVNRLIFCALKDIQPYETLYLNYNGDKAVCEYPTNNFVH